MLYDLLYKTVLTRIDPELIHDVCIEAIEATSRVPLVRDAVRQLWGRRPVLPVPSANHGGPFIRPVPGLLGLAAGMDKDAEAVLGMSALGYAFVEIGTVTPRPQPGNEAPRLWRLMEDRGLRNRIGFNNAGADAAAAKLRELRRHRGCEHRQEQSDPRGRRPRRLRVLRKNARPLGRLRRRQRLLT